MTLVEFSMSKKKKTCALGPSYKLWPPERPEERGYKVCGKSEARGAKTRILNDKERALVLLLPYHRQAFCPSPWTIFNHSGLGMDYFSIHFHRKYSTLSSQSSH